MDFNQQGITYLATIEASDQVVMHQKAKLVTNLKLGNKVDITLGSQLVPDPFLEDLGEALVDLEPTRVEAQAERGTVGAVMPGIEPISLLENLTG